VGFEGIEMPGSAGLASPKRVGRLTWGLAFGVAGIAGVCTTAALADSVQAPPPAQERRVDIEAYDVDGNTKLDQDTVESAVYPFLGPQRSREDVDGAREALQKAYQAHGYQSVVVEIPPQAVTEGIVKLHVVEAPVGRLRVVGSQYFSPSVIRNQVPSLAQGNVPNFDDAQRQISDLNRIPDRQVSPVLKPGKVPGTVDVDLHVKDTLPFHASAEINNDHSANTPPLRVVGTARYDNLWQLGHTISATYLAAPQDVAQSQVFAGSYLAPIWGTPWTLLMSGYKSNSNVNSLGGATVLGNGYALNGRAILNLPPLDDFSQSLSFGINFNHFLENVTVLQTAACVSPEHGGSCVTIEYWPVTASYNLSRSAADSTTDASLSVTAGTRGLGSPPNQISDNRSFATGNFVHLNFDLSYTENLVADVQAVFHVTAQLADQPLVPTEQFAAGGLTSVRGYLQSEAIGDNGFSHSFELRSPSLGPLIDSYVQDWRFFIFGEWANTWILEPLSGQQDQFRLASTGAGSRFQIFDHISGNVDVAFPLKDGPTTKAFTPVTSFSLKTEF
jgi:hemolysin activation/secretion protein